MFNKFPQVKYQMSDKKDNYSKIFQGERSRFMSEEGLQAPPPASWRSRSRRKVWLDFCLSYVKN